MFPRCAFVFFLFSWLNLAQEAPVAWAAGMDAGKAAFAAGKYDDSVAAFTSALQQAEEAAAPSGALLPILQSLASSLRVSGKYAEAEQTFNRVLTITTEIGGVSSEPAAAVLSDIAQMQRAQDRHKEAAETLLQAIRIRELAPLSEALARDWTLLGTIQQEMTEDGIAMASYQRAVTVWSAFPGSGLQILTAIDPLTLLFKDRLEYETVEALCVRAMRLRESMLGPNDSQLLATLDLLAYALFGQKRYADAEPVYQRLLALWESNAGPGHPMIALTLDKMVEFYTAQKLYDKAEPLARRALSMRTKATIESFHRTGRMLVGAEKFEEAADLYARVIRIAGEAGMPDEEIEGLLQTEAKLLRQLKRNTEARAVEQRLRKPAAPPKTTPGTPPAP